MTIKQAVINVCAALKPGEMILGYEMYERVLAEMKRHGDFRRPLQETVAKDYRNVRELCNMESTSGISEYTKKGIVELSAEEKRQGQKALF